MIAEIPDRWNAIYRAFEPYISRNVIWVIPGQIGSVELLHWKRHFKSNLSQVNFIAGIKKVRDVVIVYVWVGPKKEICNPPLAINDYQHEQHARHDKTREGRNGLFPVKVKFDFWAKLIQVLNST
jgi:hypothetical protein